MAERRRAREQGAAEAPRLRGRERLREEHPDVRALAGARDLHVGGHRELRADLAEGRDVTAPCGLVEVERQEVAALVGEEGIDADRVAAGEVVVQHLVCDREQCPA